MNVNHFAGLALGAFGATEFFALANVPRGDHTLFVHAHSPTGQEVVLTIPIVAS